MANIGATTAFYKVETSLTRANNEVSKSMERLATGKANANAGDRSSYVAMADTFRLDFVGTKAGIKGASVVMGYLETGMRVLDSASALLSRLQELAVLGANDTNTEADAAAIDAEAEAIADEFHRLMSTSTYKGKDIFVASANSEYVSMGGRNSEMNFGLGRVDYSDLYLSTYSQYALDNADLIVGGDASSDDTIFAVKEELANLTFDTNSNQSVIIKNVAYEAVSSMGAADPDDAADVAKFTNFSDVVDPDEDPAADPVVPAAWDFTEAAASGTNGQRFTATASGQTTGGTRLVKQENQLIFAASEGMHFTDEDGNPVTNKLTNVIEDVQAKINTARVQAGSQYAALESAVNYTTDLTAQYELGYNTVNDVNFSMETAHLAKNQILQQAATAMLAQANQGQQGLLQLIS